MTSSRQKRGRYFMQAGSRSQEKINDIPIGQRANQNDLRLDINIAVCSGDWERIAAIIDREWDRRDSHDSETLMNLARLAEPTGTNTRPRASACEVSRRKGSR